MKRGSHSLVLTLAAAALLLAAAAVLIIVFSIPSLGTPGTAHGGYYTQHHLHILLFTPASPIAQENALPGTSAWQIDPGADTTFIQGYAGATTVTPGTRVPLYISSRQPIAFTLDVYRLGWYQGLGGRLYLHDSHLRSLAQGTWSINGWMSPCGTCSIASATRLLEAHWKVTTSIVIGTTWLSGVYLIKLTAANHAESYIPLVVGPSLNALRSREVTVVADLPFNTYQAYNLWGGYSLYGEEDAEGAHSEEPSPPIRAYKVSFDRPYIRSAGAGDLLAWDIHIVRWMERTDLNVAYITDDALASTLAVPQRRVIVMVGHSEYWTKAMRDALDQARDTGSSLAFLGADDGYWQARYEPDAEGRDNRTLVCYKVASAPIGADSKGHSASTLALDPDFPKHPDVVTALWRDPILHRPESELLGLEYRGILAHNVYPAWHVVPGPLDPMLVGTGLTPGVAIPGGLLGYEFDGAGEAGFVPAHLHILSDSEVVTRYHVRVHALTAYYRTASGGIVFDAGSIWWGWGLDESSPPDAYQANVLRGEQAINLLTYNIMSAMLSASA
jgi:hypothetical protein